MKICLPDDEIKWIHHSVQTWLTKRIATKWEILSLVGLLLHATKVVHCGKTFVGSMYTTAAKVKKLDFYTCLTKEFQSDLSWWHTFLTAWHGLSLLRGTTTPPTPELYIQIDALGSWAAVLSFMVSGSSCHGTVSGHHAIIWSINLCSHCAKYCCLGIKTGTAKNYVPMR